ncbi:lipopolysaccharide biosynthesis protein [Psychrobacillus sp. OK032]|uniref:lipopolysaccharide biosynthesis protein n=1 Tax=Psychrobacillus sp. OK032 TaxID=1884358 RepID=UPI0008BF94E3|nr:oligosaccharide flippase family protein [Psychrobacillus sp. OK032]SER70841.1 Membrane protein involved in the export of O-antigen and teichoic acid [Psychrobacillus sp. OK032]
MLKAKFYNKKKPTIKPLSLKKNFSWTLIGNIIYAVCQWGLLVALAKIGSPEMMGKFALALAISAPIMMLTNLQLRAVQSTDTEELYHFSDYLGLRLITCLLALVLITIVVVVVGYPLEIILIVLIITISKIIESISDVIFGLLQKNELMDRISISMILKGILSLITLVIVISITKNLIYGTLALVFSWLLVLLFYDIRNAREFTAFKPKFRFLSIFNLVKLSLPLGIVFLILSLNTNIPRYFLEYYFGVEELGFFIAMAYLIVAGNTIIIALGQSATPRLAKDYASGNRKKFSILLLRLIFIAFFIGVIGMVGSLLFGKPLLTLIYKEDYANNSDVFFIIMLAGMINYIGSVLGYGMTATRSFKIQPYISFVSLISGLISSILLIPIYGLMGAAYTLVLSASVQLVLKSLALIYLTYNKKPEHQT